jgi:hypothetical protein
MVGACRGGKAILGRNQARLLCAPSSHAFRSPRPNRPMCAANRRRTTCAAAPLALYGQGGRSRCAAYAESRATDSASLGKHHFAKTVS